jgi:cystathionine beta-synthase
LSVEIPGAYYANQYNNLSNRTAHYEQTGPEIWEQTEGKITHLVVGVGTGGTISGTGKYLKEKNPNIKIWGIDTYGSVFKKFHETGEFDEKEIYPYITEGIGEDILPENVDFSVIDKFEKVTDKDGLIYQRRLAREEGILVGNSAGSAIKGIEQLKDELDEDSLVVVIFHDHGSNYMGKAFNDEWMIERGFLDKKVIKTALDLVENHKHLHLVTIDENEDILVLLEKMEKFDISQIPVSNEAGELVGSITDTNLFHECIKNPDVRNNKVKEIMQAPFPMVNTNTSVDEISSLFTRDNSAVLVKDLAGETHIITKFDVISSLS